MGVLRPPGDGSDHTLPAQCLVGRTGACSLRLDDRFVSAEHAKITWTGTEWLVRDLGSSNGTFLDGKRMTPGDARPLDRGTRIGFGSPDEAWTVVEVSGPGARAVDVASGTIVAARADLIVLPDEASAEISVFVDPRTGQWVSEDRDGHVSATEDGQVMVTADGRAWRLELPVAADATPLVDLAMTLDNVEFHFAVSSDEERVEVSVLLHGVPTRLDVREHGYFLLTLARERQADADLPLAERGWRTNAQLTRMLRLDTSALRVTTHRARQQLAEIGLEGAVGIVETKRGVKRLGTDRFEIVRLAPDGS